MTKFEEWWNKEMNYVVDDDKVDPNLTDRDIRIHEKRAAKRAWNAAINKSIKEAKAELNHHQSWFPKMLKRLKESYE